MQEVCPDTMGYARAASAVDEVQCNEIRIQIGELYPHLSPPPIKMYTPYTASPCRDLSLWVVVAAAAIAQHHSKQLIHQGYDEQDGCERRRRASVQRIRRAYAGPGRATRGVCRTSVCVSHSSVSPSRCRTQVYVYRTQVCVSLQCIIL